MCVCAHLILWYLETCVRVDFQWWLACSDKLWLSWINESWSISSGWVGHCECLRCCRSKATQFVAAQSWPFLLCNRWCAGNLLLWHRTSPCAGKTANKLVWAANPHLYNSLPKGRESQRRNTPRPSKKRGQVRNHNGVKGTRPPTDNPQAPSRAKGKPETSSTSPAGSPSTAHSARTHVRYNCDIRGSTKELSAESSTAETCDACAYVILCSAGLFVSAEYGPANPGKTSVPTGFKFLFVYIWPVSIHASMMGNLFSQFRTNP